MSVGGELFVVGDQGTIGESARSGDVAGDSRCGDDFGAGEIALGIARSHTAFEVAIRGRDADFAFLQQSGSESDAGAATWRQRNRPRVEQRLPDAAFLRFLLCPCTGRAYIELHAGGDFLAA